MKASILLDVVTFCILGKMDVVSFGYGFSKYFCELEVFFVACHDQARDMITSELIPSGGTGCNIALKGHRDMWHPWIWQVEHWR